MNQDQLKASVVHEVQKIYPGAFEDVNLGRAGGMPSRGQAGPSAPAGLPATDEIPYEIDDVDDLLGLEDERFVRQCYLALLGRDPDEEGFRTHLNALRSGSLDQLGVIHSLVSSPEGKIRNAQLKGLSGIKRQRKLQSLPLVGRPLKFLADVRRTFKLNRRIERLEAIVRRQQAVLQQQQAVFQQQQAVMQKLSEPKSPEFDQEDYDQFYLEFENHFRGDRETITERQSFYLPMVRELQASLGKFPVLDVPCGRGEWLCLLKENQIDAEGVDINAASLEECRIRNLTVHQRDAFDFLRSAESSTYLAVTSLHFVEHLPLPAILTLIDEIRRVLVPGGKIILETPNPSNLIVGAHTFYIDPTHKHPLPPKLLEFMVTQRGFNDVVMHGLQPCSDVHFFKNFDGVERLNELLFGCRDYCIIGTK